MGRNKLAFFAVEPLTLMISSRCSDQVPFQRRPQSMSEVRRGIKKALEEIEYGGKSLFDVWIHEDEAGLAADQSSWDHCMSRARRADIVLVLYNGNAGWEGTYARTGDYIGICHAEFQEAFDRCPGKVRTVQFPAITAAPGTPHERFQKYFGNQGVFGAQVKTGEEAIAGARDAALGFPDAIVVSAPFGVYVADDVQKIQMVFISNCRDETTTRHHVQRFLIWLDQQGEDRRLAARAVSRRKIADLIAEQQNSATARMAAR